MKIKVKRALCHSEPERRRISGRKIDSSPFRLRMTPPMTNDPTGDEWDPAAAE